MIERHLNHDGRQLWYEDWGRFRTSLPTLGGFGLSDVGVSSDYPLKTPMSGAFARGNTAHLEQEARFYNHSGDYLE